MNSATWSSNPYFNTIYQTSLPLNVWCISIGILFPHNFDYSDYTNSANVVYPTVSGVYRLDTLEKIYTPPNVNSVIGSWRFLNANVSKIMMRNYLYYDSAPPSTSTNIEWYKPTILCADDFGVTPNRIYDMTVTDIINFGYNSYGKKTLFIDNGDIYVKNKSFDEDRLWSERSPYSGGKIYFGNSNYYTHGAIGGIDTRTSYNGSYLGGLGFFTFNGSGGTNNDRCNLLYNNRFDRIGMKQRMIIDHNGHVGIGTNFPTQQLDVAIGNMNINNSIIFENNHYGNIKMGYYTATNLTYTDGVTWDNIAIGNYALQNAPLGNKYNIGVGCNSLRNGGSQNVSLGIHAGMGQTGTTQLANVYVGNYAGKFISTGAYNTFLGFYAGFHGGSNNSGGGVGDSNYNIAIGHAAASYGFTSLRTATEEANRVEATGCSIAIGHKALYMGTTSYSNIAIGTLVTAAGSITGNDNICIGHTSRYYGGSGAQNICIGRNTGYNTMNGNYNLCFGYGSGYSGGTGYGNVFMGKYAGRYYNNSAYNIYIGEYTGYGSQLNSGAHYNIGMGYYTLEKIYTGDYNQAIGYQAGRKITTGSDNNLYGRYAGYYITTGSENSCFGLSAGEDITTGNYNTCLGKHAGGFLTTGSKNICIGYWAGPTSGSGTNTGELYIGAIGSGSSSQIIYGNNIQNTTITSRNLYLNATVYTPNGTVSTSDERIKTEIEDVPDEMALNQILSLETKYYNYKDPNRRQQHKTIGFIAQDVKKIMPIAVKTSTGFIPDILKNVNIEINKISNSDDKHYILYKLKIIDNIDISENTKIKIIINDDSEVDKTLPLEIKSINNEQEFNIKIYDISKNIINDYKTAFVYGREVDDFLHIDKDKIFALHHSGIQQLHKNHLNKTSELEEKINNQQTTINNLQTMLANLESRLINLEENN